MFDLLNDIFLNVRVDLVEKPNDGLMPWFAAVTPLFASIIALFLGLYGEAVRRKLHPPKLSVRLAEKEGATTNEGGVDGPLRTFVHLVVENQRRGRSIHDVQVCLLDVICQLDGDPAVHGYAGPIPLPWRHKLGGGDGTLPRTIGAPCEADLLNFNGKEVSLSLPAGTPFRLPSPLVTRNGIFAGSARGKFDRKLVMRIFAQARGTEADSDIIEVRFEWELDGPIDPTLGLPRPEICDPIFRKKLPEEVLSGRKESGPKLDERTRRLFWGGSRQFIRV